MENLFENLFRWAKRHDENFVTETFAFVLNYLLDHELETGLGLVRWLSFGEEAEARVTQSRPQVTLQFRTDDGVPDIRITANDMVALVEVKKGSGLGTTQLERYRKILAVEKPQVKRLILLTLYPVEFQSNAERPDRHVTWHQVARWLKENAKIKDVVARFLIDQFTSFLERQRMAIQQVGKEYVSGMEAYARLAAMICQALDGAGIQIYKKPRGGTRFWVCYVGSKKCRPYCVKIRFDKPTLIRFEFVKMKHDPAKLSEGEWQLWKRRRPCRLLNLDDAFFESEAQDQLMRLRHFFEESLQAAQSICVAGQAELKPDMA
jgi:hypothetical protein